MYKKIFLLSLFFATTISQAMEENPIIEDIQDPQKTAEQVIQTINNNQGMINHKNTVTERTPLITALERGWLAELKPRAIKIATHLINQGADVGEKQDINSPSPLRTALSYDGYDEIVMLLLSKGAKPSAFDIAKIAGKPEIFKTLQSIDFNETDGKQYTPLHHAIAQNNDTAVKNLLAAGADANKKIGEDTPLMVVTQKVILAKDKEKIETIFKELLTKGKNSINEKDYIGNSALTYAIINKNTEFITELLNNGAKVTIRDIFKAAAEQNLLTTLLTKGKIDINTQDELGKTAAMQAASSNSVAELKNLVAAKADLTLKDKNGNTALFYALKDEYPNQATINCIKYLLSKASIVNEKNNNGETALTKALNLYSGWAMDKSGQLEVIKTLLNFGADITIKAKGKQSLEEIIKERPKSKLANVAKEFLEKNLINNFNNLAISLSSLSAQLSQ